MDQKEYDVFISYSRKDYVDEYNNVIPDNVVSRVKDAFVQNGISFWFDEEYIYSSQNWTDIIVDSIEKCKAFVFLSTTNANNSVMTSKEIAVACELHKPIIPFRVDKSSYSKSVLFRIADLDYVEYYKNPEKGMEDLVRSVNHCLKEIQAEKYMISAEDHTNAELKKIQDEILQVDKKVGDLVLVKNEHGKYGFKDPNGKLVLPCQWEDAYPFSDGLARVKNVDNQWGFIDKNGKVIIKFQWNEVKSFRELFAAVKNRNGNWGYINLRGEIAIPCRWYHAWSFKNGLARVKISNDKYRYIDKRGYILGSAKHL